MRQLCWVYLFFTIYSNFVMDFLKINLFYLSYWLRLLSIVCGNIESNPGPGSDRRVRVLCLILTIFMPIFTSWLWLDRIMFWVVLSLKFLLPPSLRAQRLRNSTPGAQGMALYVRKGDRSFRQSKLECSCHEPCVFRICSRINNFYFALYHNPGHDGSLNDCLLDSMARVQSVDDKAVLVFVGDANAHHCEWLELVSFTDRNGRDALDVCNLSGCEQLVRCPSHIAVNRLDLVITDVPNIVDVVVGTPQGTSDHCFVSCELRVEKSVPEYNVRSTVFLKHTHQLEQCPKCNQELYMEHHFKVS